MTPGPIELRRIEPEKGRFRFYRLDLWPDLFGGYALMREWGRLEQPGRVRLDSFATEEEATRAFQKLRQAKERRGYRLAGQGRGISPLSGPENTRKGHQGP